MSLLLAQSGYHKHHLAILTATIAHMADVTASMSYPSVNVAETDQNLQLYIVIASGMQWSAAIS
ncbi:MAG: hypothetical protein IIB95_07225 [Candidatus Marinimicrobia bacterium]|nr:hypothetical protein [Candidatus Neomarinimicrobiota bacterium]